MNKNDYKYAVFEKNKHAPNYSRSQVKRKVSWVFNTF